MKNCTVYIEVLNAKGGVYLPIVKRAEKTRDDGTVSQFPDPTKGKWAERGQMWSVFTALTPLEDWWGEGYWEGCYHYLPDYTNKVSVHTEEVPTDYAYGERHRIVGEMLVERLKVERPEIDWRLAE